MRSCGQIVFACFIVCWFVSFVFVCFFIFFVNVFLFFFLLVTLICFCILGNYLLVCLVFAGVIHSLAHLLTHSLTHSLIFGEFPVCSRASVCVYFLPFFLVAAYFLSSFPLLLTTLTAMLTALFLTSMPLIFLSLFLSDAMLSG